MTGSPPRVRGRPKRSADSAAVSRFTPACAGQTYQRPVAAAAAAVHPRVCGADPLPHTCVNPSAGSPPRVRGRREFRLFVHNLIRFTPACAGQTADEAVRHACVDGSPPRVRGRLDGEGEVGIVPRFTPACAGQTFEGGDINTIVAVHPRVCGADFVGKPRRPALRGSPPRVRGRLHVYSLSILRPRFTPACAGQTEGIRFGCATDAGSPPRVRGRLLTAGILDASLRFTPACAGQTRLRRVKIAAQSVHPRVCGADRNPVIRPRHHLGSPPRVRGRPLTSHCDWQEARFTPACAGQTPYVAPCARRSSVHPRVCGADIERTRSSRARYGSPPRVRGRPHFEHVEAGRLRFTPACAGQTRDALSPSQRRAVHPRVCGADSMRNGVWTARRGSPPRVRGRRLRFQFHTLVERFTPACAGQTCRSGGGLAGGTVHPRVCGADFANRLSIQTKGGSPPRVRGRRPSNA